MTNIVRPDHIPTEGFYCDQGSHGYWLDGLKLPSVTTILAQTGLTDYRGFPSAEREFYLARGRAVHSALHQITMQRFDRFYLQQQPQCAGFITSGERWLEAARCEVVLAEVPVYHRVLQYAGRPDLIVLYQGRLCLIDWKNNSAARSARIQLMLYKMAIPSLGETIGYVYCDEPHDRLAVELHEDGSMAKARWYDEFELEDQATAEAAITVYHWATAA